MQDLQILPYKPDVYTEYTEVKSENPHFIEANTKEVTLNHLENDCIVPVFSKDNELTISHAVFIETVWNAAKEFFRGESIEKPSIRVSHMVKGRIPEAIHKPVAQLTEADKTIYYERMMFCFEIPTIYETVSGNKLKLSIGGVRAYNHMNLYSKKVAERFKVFIGFQNQVCCNLCVTTDGYLSQLEASNTSSMTTSLMELFHRYDPAKHLHLLQRLSQTSLTESQFCQLLGRMRLYPCLPSKIQNTIPEMLLTDTQVNNVARSYVCDENFAGINNELSLWKFYNLLTGANKSSYIDSFLDRSENATALANGIQAALDGDNKYRWFLS